MAGSGGLLNPDALEQEALRQLAGVGDAGRGEWREWTGRAFHIRRCISVAEQRRSGLTIVDIRRTPEAARRAAALGDLIRMVPREVVIEEVGV